MKKIIFLLLLISTTFSYGQTTLANKLKITGNVEDITATKVAVQTNEGLINWRDVLDIRGNGTILSTGLIKNGLISANGDPTKFNVTSGIGVVSNFDTPENPISRLVTFPAFTGVTPTYLLTGTITYVAIEEIGTSGVGQLFMQATPFTPEQRRSLIILGAVIHSNLTTINLLNNISAPSNASTNQLHDFIEAVGALNLTGNKYTANGANLQLDKSAGLIFKLGSNFANDWKNPHELAQTAGTSLTFRYRTQNGTEGSDRINLDPALYDLNNVLTSVPNNKFTIQTVTMFQSGVTRIQYGQNVYDDLATAKNAVFTRNFVLEPNSKENGIIRAYIIMKNTTTSLQNVADADILEAQKFGGVASGGVALTLANIVTALGYTPENVANKQNSLAVDGTGTKYATVDAVRTHSTDTNNPHAVTKTQVGLSNVDNTSDLNKPISTLIQSALNLKANQSTTYTKTEVDSRLSNLSQAYHVDFTDAGTHIFTVPSNVIIQNVTLNNIPVYGADWSQTGTSVTVTTSITGDKVTLSGGTFVSLDLTNYATNTELSTYAKSPLDYQNTTPIDGFIVNNTSLFVDNSNYGINWIFAPTDSFVPYNGYVSKFSVKLTNAEVGRTVRFYILRQTTGLNYTIIYDSGNIVAELSNLNTYSPITGAVSVQANDIIGVKVNYISSANSIRFRDSGGAAIATTVRFSGVASVGNTYLFTAEENKRKFFVDATVIGTDLVVSKFWGNKPNGYVGLNSDGYIYNSIGKVSELPWSGKKIIWVGTSIPAGMSPSYPAQVGSFLNANLVNESVGSSGIIWDGTRALSLSATIAELTASFPGNEAQSYQNKLIGKAPDLVVFDHGHNDRLQATGVRLGTLTSTDKSTFYGAFNFVINALYADNPNVKIVFITPPNRFTVSGTQTTAMDDTRNAILALANKYGAPVCDLMKLANFNEKNYSVWTSDGTHPTQTATNNIAVILYNFLKGVK